MDAGDTTSQMARACNSRAAVNTGRTAQEQPRLPILKFPSRETASLWNAAHSPVTPMRLICSAPCRVVAADTGNNVGVAGTAGGSKDNAGVSLMHLVMFGKTDQGGSAQ
eukprot:5676428-Pleurochrysis_carterae.AAC.1